jgi:hypothetical protein
VLAALALEGHAERLLECLASGGQGGKRAALLYSGSRLARVGSKKPGELLRCCNLRLTQHGAFQEVRQALALGVRRGVWMSGQRPELGLA